MKFMCKDCGAGPFDSEGALRLHQQRYCQAPWDSRRFDDEKEESAW